MCVTVKLRSAYRPTLSVFNANVLTLGMWVNQTVAWNRVSFPGRSVFYCYGCATSELGLYDFIGMPVCHIILF